VTIAVAAGPAGATFAVRVVPRAGKTAIAGARGDALLVRLAAAPVDGAANDALIAFLAELFARPKRDVTLVAGHSSRHKRVAIAGVPPDEVATRLRRLLEPA
jgi:uncharacterized protein